MLTRALFALVLAVGTALAASAEEAKLNALGLTDHAVTQEELDNGAGLSAPKFNTPGVAYVSASGLKKGDTVEVALNKDGKVLMHNVQTVESDGANILLLAGKAGVPAGGWPAGQYTASVKIKRDGKPLIEEVSEPMVFE
jgi:hypothetical protein